MNRTWKSYALTIAAAERMLGLVPAGTHDWRKYLSPEELTRLLHSPDVKLHVSDVSGMVIAHLDPWSRRIQWTLSNRDTDVNYILHAVCDGADTAAASTKLKS
jgi:2-polyprenyl-6-hydroxyphenyl methylase/3-demethylubiquinone-9 3-methyltransferase